MVCSVGKQYRINTAAAWKELYCAMSSSKTNYHFIQEIKFKCTNI